MVSSFALPDSLNREHFLPSHAPCLDDLLKSGLPTAVLFDWDSTLVDSWKIIYNAFNKTLTTYGHEPWNEDFATTNMQKSGREAFPKIFGDQALEAQKIFYQAIEDDHYQNLSPLPQAESLLKTLKLKNIPLGVVSNKKNSALRKEVIHLKWDSYFNILVGAGDAAQDKPAADPALLALENMKVSPSLRVWMVGDAPVDWQCALAANCQPVVMGNRFDSSSNNLPLARNCEELEKIFLKI